MRKFVSLLAATAALTIAAPAAAAVTLQTDINGKLTGATGVNVNGTLYDVIFVDRFCSQVFGACDVAHFNFTSSAAAGLAAQALIDQVFVSGAFDDDPSLTFGCTDLTACNIYIPYAVPSSSSVSVSVAQNFAAGAGLPDRAFAVGGNAFTNQSTADLSAVVYGRFTLSAGPVPEPATWAMMLLGFGGIGFAVRRQRKVLVTA